MLEDSDVEFLSKARNIFFSLFNSGLETHTVGDLPTYSAWHGFLTGGGSKGLLALVNSTGFPQYISLEISGLKDVEVLFTDMGYSVAPQVCSEKLSLVLALEQMVLLGLGDMAKSRYYLGVDKDSTVPYDSKPLAISFKMIALNVVEGEWTPTDISTNSKNFLRISLQTFKNGLALRSKWEKNSQSGRIAAIRDLLSITINQNAQELPVAMWEPNRAVW
ncbi:unnamed protein product, partial [marine sediment metagenome]